MTTVFHTKATVVDLLDRILDRGLVINIDLIISVADVPLIGINLRAAIAGMDTMLKYGIMKDWDKAVRTQGRIKNQFTKSPEPIESSFDKLISKLNSSCLNSLNEKIENVPGYEENEENKDKQLCAVINA